MAYHKFKLILSPWLQALIIAFGFGALFLFFVQLFHIQISHLSEGIDPKTKTTRFEKFEFNATCLFFLLIALIAFFNRPFINILGLVRISKVKISDLEVQLDYLDKELQGSNKTDTDDKQAYLGLLNLFSYVLEYITCQLEQRLFDEPELRQDQSLTPERRKELFADPGRLASFLYTSLYLRPEYIQTFLTLQNVRNQLLMNPKKFTTEEMMKSVGLALVLKQKQNPLADESIVFKRKNERLSR